MHTIITREILAHRNLSTRLQGIQRRHFYTGPSSDIYLVCFDEKDKTVYALKVLRLTGHRQDEGSRRDFLKQVARELSVWLSLNHPNLLPIIGYCTSPDEPFGFVSRFMQGGSALDYVRTHPAANIPSMCAQIAEGLRYLHASGVIHGDLKGTNVVIDDSGELPQALICDFGSSRFMDKEGYTTVAKSTLAWTARELVVPSDYSADATEASDVWALGMTIYELETRAPPYSDLQLSNHMLAHRIGSGLLPSRFPTEEMKFTFSDTLWDLLQCCWRTNPEERPTAEAVRNSLGGRAVPAVSSFVADALPSILGEIPFDALPTPALRAPSPIVARADSPSPREDPPTVRDLHDKASEGRSSWVHRILASVTGRPGRASTL